jgi:lipoyl(octanoyl) transferase
VIPQWIGRVGYGWAWRLQHLRRDAVIAGTAPEAFWLLEHDPVITTGRREVGDLPSEQALRARGVELFHTERGGLATWHGPGQLVGYLILSLGAHRLKVRTTIHGVEQGIIDWCRSRGLPADRRGGYPGVWVGSDKICAIGMHFRRDVSMHGFALNLCPDLSGFGLITPCGITDGGVTSVERLLGRAPAPWEAADEVGASVLAALRREG